MTKVEQVAIANEIKRVLRSKRQEWIDHGRSLAMREFIGGHVPDNTLRFSENYADRPGLTNEPDDEPATEGDDLHAAIAQAMIEVAPDGQTATFAWSEDTHPRDDNGRFVSGGDIRRASRDPKKADELRAAVTNPEQRKKLETAIGSAKVPGKEQGLLEGKQTPIFHKEEGREFANLIRGSMVKAVKDGDHGAVDQVLKRAEHMTAIHFSEAKDKARNQILSDFGDVGPDGLAKNPKAVAAANTVSAAFDAATATIKDKYDDWAFSARDMINGDADRSDFDEAYTSVADAYEKAQDSIWDAVQAARDSLGGKEKGYKLGRYFMSEDFSDEPATEGDDLHAAIAQAMIEVAHDAAESGDDPSEELDRLRELLDDPDTLARVMSGEPESEDFAGGSWQEHMHPRGKNGRFLAKDAMEDAKSDPKEAARLRAQVRPEDADKLEAVLSGGPSPGRTRRGAQREAAAKRRAEKVSTREAAEKVIAKLTREGDLKGKVTPEDLHALADHLASGHMTVADLRRTRDAMRGATIRAGFDGGKRKEEMVKSLSAYARGEARERGPKLADVETRLGGQATKPTTAEDPATEYATPADQYRAFVRAPRAT